MRDLLISGMVYDLMDMGFSNDEIATALDYAEY